MTAPHGNAVAAALPVALAAGTREAFEELLTDDVRWGGEHGGNECRTRIEAGEHYAACSRRASSCASPTSPLATRS